MKILSSLILSFILVGLWSCSDSGSPVDSGSDTSDPVVDDCGFTDGDNSSCVNYSTEIQPIFTNNCGNCHLGSSFGGLNLSTYADVMNGGESGDVVMQGNSSESLIILKLRNSHNPAMPMGNCCIESSLIDLIATWIDEEVLDN